MWVHSINKDRETHRGICYHIYWNMLQYLFEYATIFIRICHIYWNTLSYLLEYMLPYLFEYVTIFIRIRYHIY